MVLTLRWFLPTLSRRANPVQSTNPFRIYFPGRGDLTAGTTRISVSCSRPQLLLKGAEERRAAFRGSSHRRLGQFELVRRQEVRVRRGKGEAAACPHGMGRIAPSRGGKSV